MARFGASAASTSTGCAGTPAFTTTTDSNENSRLYDTTTTDTTAGRAPVVDHSMAGLPPTAANILTIALTWRDTLSPVALHQIFTDAIASLSSTNSSGPAFGSTQQALCHLLHALGLLGLDFTEIRDALADTTLYHCANLRCSAPKFYAWQNGPRRCIVRHIEPPWELAPLVPGGIIPPRRYPCCEREVGAFGPDGSCDNGICWMGWHVPAVAVDNAVTNMGTGTEITTPVAPERAAVEAHDMRRSLHYPSFVRYPRGRE